PGAVLALLHVTLIVLSACAGHHRHLHSFPTRRSSDLWLADQLWPGDEYLDLEYEWLAEADLPDQDGHYLSPLCPHCRLRREDVWPCPSCGRLLHPSCGHGMRRRRVDRPYRTHGTHSEAVIGDWVCTGTTAVDGIDVDHCCC